MTFSNKIFNWVKPHLKNSGIVANRVQSTNPDGYGIVYASPNIQPCHQGYIWDGSSHYIIHTNQIYKKDNNETWSHISSNLTALTGLPGAVNHLGDGFHHDGKLYIPCEYYASPVSYNTQRIAVFSASTLELLTVYDISAQGHEVSGMTADVANNTAYVSSFVDSDKIFKYNFNDFSYIGYISLDDEISEIQGVTYCASEQKLFISANAGEIYSCNLDGSDVTLIIATSSVSGESFEGIEWVESDKTIRWVKDNSFLANIPYSNILFVSQQHRDIASQLEVRSRNASYGVPTSLSVEELVNCTSVIESLLNKASELIFKVNSGLRWCISSRPSSDAYGLRFYPSTNGLNFTTPVMTLQNTGRVGLNGVTNPTSRLHLPAGSATASTAPLKFSSGVNLTTPEAGSVEYDGTNYYVTNSSGRYKLAKILNGVATLDFTSVLAGGSNSLTLTVTGAAVGEAVSIGYAYTAGIIYSAYVSSTNTVTIVATNITGSPIDPGPSDFTATVFK